MVNMGGGFPTKYLRDVPSAEAYGRSIYQSLREHFGNQIPETIIEPGRGMVGNAGVIKTEVVLISKKSDKDTCAGCSSTSASSAVSPRRWTSRSATRSDRARRRREWSPACSPARPAIRPTCCMKRISYPLPVTLSIGDEMLIEGTGAYTTTYSAVAFNGFDPLKSYII
jgi:ornithine decarboxylase